MSRLAMLGLAVVAGLGVGLVSKQVFAGTTEYTFTNDTGEIANDLHIEFKQGVDWSPDPPPPFTTSSGQGTSTFDASGGEVAAATEMPAVTFTTTGTGPTIKKGWWTSDGQNIGNLDSDNTDPYP